MNLTRTPAAYLLAVLCAFLIACGSVTLPQTTAQRIAVAQALTTQLRVAATHLLTAKVISADDASNVLEVTDAASDGIAIALSMAVSNPAGADSKLTTVMALLSAVQRYLATKTPGVKTTTGPPVCELRNCPSMVYLQPTWRAT